MLPDRPVVISNDGRESVIFDETIQHLAALRTFDDEITDRNYAVVCTKFDHSEQILQLLKTAVNVANDDGSAHDVV
jgi:hypothetical protein